MGFLWDAAPPAPLPIHKQPNGIYHVEFQFLGQRVHRSARTRRRSEALAFESRLRQAFHERAGYGSPRKKPELALDQACERYFTEHLAPRARHESSLKSERYLLDRIVATVGSRKPLLSELEPADLSRLIDYGTCAGWKPATLNRHLAVLRAVLRRAEAHWGVRVSGIQVRTDPVHNERSRTLTADEERRLLEALRTRPWTRDLALFLLYTGLRLGEALRLEWSDVSLTRGVVHVRRSKNGQDRVVPLPECVRALLQRLSARPQAIGEVFRGPSGAPYKRPHGAFKAACDRAVVPGLRIHDLRHTYASRLVEAGVSLYKVSRLLGHRDVRMTQRYAHLQTESLAAEVALLDR